MKPLLLIDVDGPLNPYAALSRRRPPEGYTRHRMRPTGWTTGPALPVLLNPRHGEELLALAARYELVWATTWKDEANEWVGPRLGLPALPYVDWPAMHGSAPAGTYWKTQYVVEYAAGRPFAWIDDEITELDRAWITAGQGADGSSLLLRIDPWVGLQRADFDALAAWADGRGSG
ncbi:HAD domain-containing protein [Streptomyces sp. NPDC005426]|uniref:HAD domain-containing protein n=1 Tax=Streptomyces sp. NPDC005426 TaxID=3155344 RepID=UPI00339E879D